MKGETSATSEIDGLGKVILKTEIEEDILKTKGEEDSPKTGTEENILKDKSSGIKEDRNRGDHRGEHPEC